MQSKDEIIAMLTQERDDALLAAKMHLRTVQCATACLHGTSIVGAAMGPHYDSPPAAQEQAKPSEAASSSAAPSELQLRGLAELANRIDQAGGGPLYIDHTAATAIRAALAAPTVAAPSELDALESLARAATPGDWTAKPHGRVVGGPLRSYTNGSAQGQIASFSVTFHDQAPDDEPERQQANAEFCAAFGPVAALKLIALSRLAGPTGASQSAGASIYDDEKFGELLDDVCKMKVEFFKAPTGEKYGWEEETIYAKSLLANYIDSRTPPAAMTAQASVPAADGALLEQAAKICEAYCACDEDSTAQEAVDWALKSRATRIRALAAAPTPPAPAPAIQAQPLTDADIESLRHLGMMWMSESGRDELADWIERALSGAPAAKGGA